MLITPNASQADSIEKRELRQLVGRSLLRVTLATFLAYNLKFSDRPRRRPRTRFTPQSNPIFFRNRHLKIPLVKRSISC